MDRLARLNSDGSGDVSFNPPIAQNPDPDDRVTTLAIQPDGKILVGGSFSTIWGQARNKIARLNANGTLDSTFNPNASSDVYAIVVQADGKILVAGEFTSIGGITRNKIARLNSNGTGDASFIANADSSILTIALQTDGKIILGGQFGQIGGVNRNRIALVNADGSLVTNFDPNAGASVEAIAMQADGKIVTGGGFTTIGGATRNYLARLTNDAAFQQLTSNSHGTALKWNRSGSSPEISHVNFENSADNGATWNPLGQGTRIGATSNWQIAGLSLPIEKNTMVRALGQQSSDQGLFGGSSRYESTAQVYLPAIYRPDLWTGSRRGSMRGNNRYNLTGVGQKFAMRKKRRAIYYFRAQNDGNRPESLRARVRPTNARFRFKYFRLTGGRSNVTGGVARGTYRTNVAARAYVDFLVQMIPRYSRGKTRRQVVRPRVYSTTVPTLQDVGKAIIKVTR